MCIVCVKSYKQLFIAQNLTCTSRDDHLITGSKAPGREVILQTLVYINEMCLNHQEQNLNSELRSAWSGQLI